MPSKKIERTVPDRADDDLFKDVEHALDPYVKKYSLKQDVDPDHKHISVKKIGFKGDLQVEGNKVSLSLEYSRLMPGPVRQKITNSVVSALDQMVKKNEGG